MTMNDMSATPPADATLRADWFIEKLGMSNQKVMSLTVENQRLRKRVEALEALLDEHQIEEPDA
jgi:hypothetical protein